MKLVKIIIPCLLFNACMLGTSKHANFYTMNPTPAGAVSADYTAIIGVNRIQLPKYMERPQIVTQRKDSAQVNISEFNRWVETPSVLATRVLIQNLSALLPTAQIKENPLSRGGVDWTVVVEITMINAVLNEQAELTAWCTLKDNSGKIQSRQKFEYTVPVGKTYDELAKSYSQLLFKMSQDIASLVIKK